MKQKLFLHQIFFASKYFFEAEFLIGNTSFGMKAIKAVLAAFSRSDVGNFLFYRELDGVTFATPRKHFHQGCGMVK